MNFSKDDPQIIKVFLNLLGFTVKKMIFVFFETKKSHC